MECWKFPKSTTTFGRVSSGHIGMSRGSPVSSATTRGEVARREGSQALQSTKSIATGTSSWSTEAGMHNMQNLQDGNPACAKVVPRSERNDAIMEALLTLLIMWSPHSFLPASTVAACEASERQQKGIRGRTFSHEQWSTWLITWSSQALGVPLACNTERPANPLSAHAVRTVVTSAQQKRPKSRSEYSRIK